MKKLFARNVGGIDRAVRIVLGIGLLSLTVVGPESMWGLLGIIPLATGAFGVCPLYGVFGLNTRGHHGGNVRAAA